MNHPIDHRLLAQPAFQEEEDSNTSANPTFESVMAARLSRRGLLRGSVGTAATAVFGSLATAACGGGDDEVTPTPSTTVTSLGFTAVPKSLVDTLTVPAGYTATVLYRCGDPIAAGVAAAKNDGTDTSFDKRAGDCHDGIEYFGLNTAGTGPDASNSERGLLGMNHEYQNNLFLHAKRPDRQPAPGPPKVDQGSRRPRPVDRRSQAHRQRHQLRAGLDLQPPHHRRHDDDDVRPGRR